MLRADVRPGGTVALPVELQDYFGQDTTCEVVRYPDHLALWPRWARRRASAFDEIVKASRKGVFREAWQRHRRAVAAIRGEQPGVALYLSGYVLEGRLKELVCEARGTESLQTAEEHLNRERGTHYSLLGSDGHRLDLLWDVAGLQSFLLRGTIAAACVAVFRWSTAWRYQVDRVTRSAQVEYWIAYDMIVDFLENR